MKDKLFNFWCSLPSCWYYRLNDQKICYIWLFNNKYDIFKLTEK